MDKKHRQKLVEGKQRYLAEQVGLVARIGDEIEIYADPYQYILKIKGHSEQSYFSSMDGVIEELMDIQAKRLMLQKEEKTLESVREAIMESRLWIKEFVEPLLSLKSQGNHNDSEV